jgi:MFS family permease
MLIFSALFGCCYGIFEVIINLQASIIEKRYQKSMMSSFHGFFSLGVLTGAFITSIFVEYQIHFFINVICYVIILAPIILICALTLVEEKEQDKKKEQSIFFLWPLLLFILVLLSITDALTEGGIDSWGSLYMRDFIKVEGFQIGLATISFNIFMVIGRFTGDRVKDILGVYSFLILLVSLSLIGITILLNFNTLILAIIGFAIVGYGSSSIVPICYSLSASIKGVDSTVGITIISIAIYGVFMIAPTIMGYIANNFGINYVFSPIVVMFIISMVIILIFKKEFKFK